MPKPPPKLSPSPDEEYKVASEVANQLWSGANAIVGFAAVQTLGFMIALGVEEKFAERYAAIGRIGHVLLTLLAALCYAALLYWLGGAERRVRVAARQPRSVVAASRTAVHARAIVIAGLALFNAVLLSATLKWSC